MTLPAILFHPAIYNFFHINKIFFAAPRSMMWQTKGLTHTRTHAHTQLWGDCNCNFHEFYATRKQTGRQILNWKPAVFLHISNTSGMQHISKYVTFVTVSEDYFHVAILCWISWSNKCGVGEKTVFWRVTPCTSLRGCKHSRWTRWLQLCLVWQWRSAS
jgi:hypothetical protein